MIAEPITTAFSGTIPTFYEKYLGPLFFEPFALEMAKRVKKMSPSSLLELASGTGRLTKYLPFVLPSGASFHATDLNPAMLQIAQDRLKGIDIDWGIVDAVQLPFADRSFEAIACQFGVMFYSDKSKAYQEAYRVLKPGGSFLFAAWDDLEHNPIAQIANELSKEFFPVDPPKFYELPFSYCVEQEIREDLASADFTQVEIELVTLKGHADTAEEIALGIFEGSPIYTTITERDASALPLIKRKMVEQLKKEFGAANLKVPIQARIVRAVK